MEKTILNLAWNAFGYNGLLATIEVEMRFLIGTSKELSTFSALERLIPSLIKHCGTFPSNSKGRWGWDAAYSNSI